jgi:hypothetical protein
MKVITKLLSTFQNSLLKKVWVLSPIIDIRSFKGINFLHEQLSLHGGPFRILDLGCAGGPTNAWQRNWPDINWLGFDGSKKEINDLQTRIPSQSEAKLGFVYSEKYCSHLKTFDLDFIEISSILMQHSFDFVKIDVDGCDVHLLQAILDSPKSDTILGIEIEVTYTSFRDSEVNFHVCADLLLKKGFEPIAIENARRYGSQEFQSPYVWDIEAQSAMGVVFQGNQTWVRKQTPHDKRSHLGKALILASYGLADWAWESLKRTFFNENSHTEYQDLSYFKAMFIPTFLSDMSLEEYEKVLNTKFKYPGNLASWRAQAQNREIEQPWFLSN